MTDHIPAAAHEAARQAVRAKIGNLLPGQTGINLADEIADAALDAAWPHLRSESAGPRDHEFCGHCHRSHLDCYC